MKRAFLPLAFLACALLASASDFGLVLSAAPRYGSSDGFELTAAATPWFSALQGETGSLFLSAMLQLEADDNGTRLEFDIRRFQYRTVAASGMILDVGRFFVSDCSGLVVSGFLDGVRVELPGDLGTFRSGVYYTGLFNKDTNYLYLSPGDKADLADPDRFFSASRAVAAAAYTRRSIFGENTLSVETLWQFDLRSGGGWLHSQYLAAALSGPLAERLTYRASLAASLVEEMNKSTAPAAAAALRTRSTASSAGAPAPRTRWRARPSCPSPRTPRGPSSTSGSRDSSPPGAGTPPGSRRAWPWTCPPRFSSARAGA